MSIKWVGVPKAARPSLRKVVREMPGTEFLVCSDKGATQKARAYIRDSLWAFNAEFIASHARGEMSDRAIEALKKAQAETCEDANEMVFSMIKSFRKFAEDAIDADGRGHFMSSYDGNENEERVEFTDENGEKRTEFFYIYRIN